MIIRDFVKNSLTTFYVYIKDTFLKKSDQVVVKGSGGNSVQMKGCNAQGDNSFAEGYNTTASGDSSHAEGSGTAAREDYSHAEGYNAAASGTCSHAEGYGTTASGYYSHVEGSDTIARGSSSHAEGQGTTTLNQSEHAEGQFNVSHSATTEYGNSGNTQHSVGIGTASYGRKNAFEIMQNGDIYIVGLGGYDGTNAAQTGVKTLQQILTDAGVA